MEGEKSEIIIRKAELDDLNEIWNIMKKIHKKQDLLKYYEDFNTRHTRDSIEKALLKGTGEYEKIWTACFENEIKGFLDIQYKASDYLFFADKYIFIRYFYVCNNEQDIAEKLMNHAIQESKKYGFEYMCGDIVPEDQEMRELYSRNGLEEYRNRMAKQLIEK